MNKELRIATAEILTTEFWEQAEQLVPTACTINIYDKGGTALVSAADCSIDSAGIVTYTLAVDLIVAADINFRAEFTATIAGSAVYKNILFDAVVTPVESVLKDNDLFVYLPVLRDGTFQTGTTTLSGTTTTLVDSHRTEIDDHWNGGYVEIIRDNEIDEGRITDFDKATNTVTFTPAVTLVEPDTTYKIRSSYQSQIDCGFETLVRDVRNRKALISRYVDSNDFKLPHAYKTLEIICRAKKDDMDDKWERWQIDYGALYHDWVAAYVAGYDADDSGYIDDDESRDSMGWGNILR